MGFINNIFARQDTTAVRLAKDIISKRSVLVDLKQQTEALTKKDIKSWHQAWQMAINVEEPRRASLYDCYTAALIDNHLEGCIEQRNGRTLEKSFILKDKAGKEDDKAKKYFETLWFRDFEGYALESIYWGHSLIQFGDVINAGTEQMTYTGCELVSRKHVIPEYGVITPEIGGDIKRGIPYRTGVIADWCIEVGSQKNLGKLLKVTPQCISKKNMLAYWDTFGEIFGMPMRVGKTNSQDKKDWVTMSSMLDRFGAAQWALIPEGSEIEIKETSRGDAYNVYDKRIDRANSEMSKAINAQTMTIDNGSSKSQSETHLDVFENVCRGDAFLIKYLVNTRLIPLMVKHGYPLEGYTFDWDEAMSYTPAEQRENERLILQYYDVDPQYFVDKYKITITGVKQQNAGMPSNLVQPTDFFA